MMYSTEKPVSTMDTSLSTGAIVGLCVGLGIGLIVVVVLIVVLLKYRRCCKCDHWQEFKSSESFQESEKSKNESPQRVQMEAIEISESKLHLTEVSIVDETKLPQNVKQDLDEKEGKDAPDGDVGANNNSDDAPPIPDRPENLRFIHTADYLKVDISMDSIDSDIEACRDYENVDLDLIKHMSLSDLPEVFRDMMNGKLSPRGKSAGGDHFRDESLLPMSPDQNTTLEMVSSTDFERESDVLDSPVVHGEDLTMTIVESEISGIQKIQKSLASIDTPDNRSVSSEELDLNVRSSSPELPPRDTDSESFSPSFDPEETQGDEDLDYQSFLSTLQLRHSVWSPTTDTESSISDNEEGEKVSGDLGLNVNTMSTPYKLKDIIVSAHDAGENEDSEPKLDGDDEVNSLERDSISPLEAPEQFADPVMSEVTEEILPMTTSIAEHSHTGTNSTFDLIKSYVNISITPEGTKERIAELNQRDGFGTSDDCDRSEITDEDGDLSDTDSDADISKLIDLVELSVSEVNGDISGDDSVHEDDDIGDDHHLSSDEHQSTDTSAQELTCESMSQHSNDSKEMTSSREDLSSSTDSDISEEISDHMAEHSDHSDHSTEHSDHVAEHSDHSAEHSDHVAEHSDHSDHSAEHSDHVAEHSDHSAEHSDHVAEHGDHSSLAVECSQTEPNLTVESNNYEYPDLSATENDLTYEELRTCNMNVTDTSSDSGRYYEDAPSERISTHISAGGLSMGMLMGYAESSSLC